MRIIFVLMMGCLSPLMAQILKEHYAISSESITSKDLFPQAPYFLITSFGENFELRIKTSELERLFESRGYPIKSNKKEVSFVYQIPWNDQKIRQKITSIFNQLYNPYKPKIQAIHLKPAIPMTNRPIQLLDIKLDEKSLKKNRFVVMIEVQEGDKKALKPFYCEIVASLEVYVAKRDLRAGEDLDLHNVILKRIDFSSIHAFIADKDEILNSSLRSFISKDQILTSSKLKPKILVKRGDLIDVSYKGEGIGIESRLEAMQGGGMHDEIMARNLESKKQIRVKIIGEKRAIVQ